MASRRTTKGVELAGVEDLLRKAKPIRKRYRALKKKWGALKDGEAIAAGDIRTLAEELQRAIDEASRRPSAPERAVVTSRPMKPARTRIPTPIPPPDVAPVHVTVSQAAPTAPQRGALPAPGLARTLLKFVAKKLAGVVEERLARGRVRPFTSRDPSV